MMLAYLEDLCAALIAHDAIAIHRLLSHPLARSLPRQVREEALAISRASPSSLRAPIQTLRFYHQCLQLRESEPAAPPTTSDPNDSGDSGGEEGGAQSPAVDDPDHPTDFAPSPPSADMADPHPASAQTADERVADSCRDQIELPFDLHASTAFAA